MPYSDRGFDIGGVAKEIFKKEYGLHIHDAGYAALKDISATVESLIIRVAKNQLGGRDYIVISIFVKWEKLPFVNRVAGVPSNEEIIPPRAITNFVVNDCMLGETL